MISFILFFLIIKVLNLKSLNEILSYKKLLIAIIFTFTAFLYSFFLLNSDTLISTPSNEYLKVINKEFISKNLDINFDHSYKTIFDRLILPFNKIRYYLIQHSLVNDANSLISIYTPSNFLDSIKLFLITIPKVIIFPYQYSGSEISLLYKVASIENLIYILLFSSFIFDHKNLKQIYLLIYFILLFALLLYLNPNIGSFYKQKSSFMYTLSFLGIINWIKIFEKININFFTKFNNSSSNNEIARISSDTFKMSLLIILISSLIIIRDHIILINTNDLMLIKLYFLLIIILGFISTAINIPLNESINSFLIKKKVLIYIQL